MAMDMRAVTLILILFLMTSLWVATPTLVLVSANPDLPEGGSGGTSSGGDVTITGDPISGPGPPGE